MSFDSPTRVDLATETVNIVLLAGTVVLVVIAFGLAFAALWQRRMASRGSL